MGKTLICYVGDAPREYIKAGHLGDYMIPGRNNGERFSSVEIHDANDFEDKGEGRKTMRIIPAAQLAPAIIGDLVDRGAFVPAGSEPTEEELVAAETRLSTHRMQIILAADDTFRATGKTRNVPEEAKRAAKALDLKREWILDVAVGKKTCPWCAEQIQPEAVVCKHCNKVVDSERYARMQGTVTKVAAR